MGEMDYEKEPQVEVMVMEPRVKPGYLTTEFWATMALSAAAIAASFGIDSEFASAVTVGFGAAVIAVYDVVRMFTKKNA